MSGMSITEPTVAQSQGGALSRRRAKRPPPPDAFPIATAPVKPGRPFGPCLLWPWSDRWNPRPCWTLGQWESGNWCQQEELYFPADTLVPAAKRSRRRMIASPGWPALIVAKVLVWLRGRLLDLAGRSMRRQHLGLAAIWLSDHLKGILAKIRPEPVREPLPPPKVYAPPRAKGRRRG
jgi:hypothetical protein